MLERTVDVASRPIETVLAWLQSGNNGLRLVVAAIGVFILGLSVAVVGGYALDWKWTGLPANAKEGPKTLWDWLELALIPLVLGVGAYLLDRAQRQREQASLQDQHREVSLQKYFDHMTDLLVEKDLRNSEPDAEIRAIARARTLTVIRRLDATRTADLLRFLHESALIEVIDLSDAALDGIDLHNAMFGGATLRNADLAGADLRNAFLKEADLRGARLTDAVLDGADLGSANLAAVTLENGSLERASMIGATLSDATLVEANCYNADLSNASLDGATLTNAVLSGVDLSGAALNNADLRGANLRGAILKGANLSSARLADTDLTRARYDGETQWPDDEPPAEAERVDQTSSPTAPAASQDLSNVHT